MATLEEFEATSKEVKAFRDLMANLPASERHAAALVEIACELKWLRHDLGGCEEYLNEIANKTS